MRELTVRISFTKHCLGNVPREVYHNEKKSTHFILPRGPEGHVLFLPSWWQSNLRKAAEVLCRHQSEVSKIRFDQRVDGRPRSIPENFFRRYQSSVYFVKHEAFFPGDQVGVNCLVPDSIPDEDFWRLLDLSGQYYGISPARPTEYGFFVVVSIQPRVLPAPSGIVKESGPLGSPPQRPDRQSQLDIVEQEI